MRKTGPFFFAIAALLFGAVSRPTVSQAGVVPSMLDDDMRCAVGYTLAGFALQSLDAEAASYFAERAATAAKRYLQMHPEETQQSYADQLIAGALNLQERLAINAVSPEHFLSDIRECQEKFDSRVII
jgi:hypothetical protein